MLSKKNRFPLKFEFSEFKKKASIYQSSLFGMLCLENGKDVSRFVFIVSKKIDKRAVERNRLKRIFSEIIASQLKNLRSGFDIVFLIKKSAVGKETKEVKREVIKALGQKNGLITGDAWVSKKAHP